MRLQFFSLSSIPKSNSAPVLIVGIDVDALIKLIEGVSYFPPSGLYLSILFEAKTATKNTHTQKKKKP